MKFINCMDKALKFAHPFLTKHFEKYFPVSKAFRHGHDTNKPSV